MTILFNHIGFERIGSKHAVVQAPPGLAGTGFVVTGADGNVAYRGRLDDVGPVANWGAGRWYFYRAAFSGLERAGMYRLTIDGLAGVHEPEASAAFRIGERLLFETTLFDCLDYFKSQRCSGMFDRADRSVGFAGDQRRERVDVHGGWYDASGDTSKYLSHLSYANFLNPQQTPLLPWAFATVAENLQDSRDALNVTLCRRLLDEAAHGGDFLVRMQDELGYFYMTVFDTWSKRLDAREICAYETQQGNKTEAWPAGLRQGGGVAIAALARLGRMGVTGAYGSAQYLAAAVRGFEHLERHNVDYLDDGTENIIDDYCGLLAATELARAIATGPYLAAARRRADQLMARLATDDRFCGWWRADGAGRPHYHAVEAGLPVVALCHYHDVEPDRQRRELVARCVATSLRFELDITNRVSNAFGYARQYVRAVGGECRDSFFMPHGNESGYWWQGENARLASLACAARMGSRLVADDSELVAQLHQYAHDQLDWVLGKNPYDACMLHGHGRNNPEYERGFPPSAGGICNGITSGFQDEDDVAFAPQSCVGRGDQIWRWGEQWLPHATWYVLAIAQPLR